MIIKDKKLISNPMISVVVCAYNRESMITQTINSILNQKCDYDFEIIIGEDNSRDKTLERCIELQKRNPERITILHHEENCGLGKNWALLVKEARGKYIASCDDDDFWHNKNKLSLQVAFLERNPTYGMVHTDYDVFNIKKNKRILNYYKTYQIQIETGNITQQIFNGRVPICVSTSMFRKELIDKYVPLEMYVDLKFNIQDWPTWMILSKYSKIGFIEESTITYRVGHYAISNYGSYEKLEKKVEQDHIMYKYICNLLSEDLEYNEDNYIRYKLNILLSVAYKKFGYKKAKEYLVKYNGYKYSSFKIRMLKYKFLFYMYAGMLYANRHLFSRKKF